MTTTSTITTRVLTGFDDASFGAEAWDRLLATGPTRSFDLTFPVQRAWWDTLGHGQLLLVVASRDDADIALAPLFESGGMIFNIASKDQLDVIGDASEPSVLDALLNTARGAVSNFLGFRLYLVPDSSPTGARLEGAAERLELSCHDEGGIVAPAISMRRDTLHAQACTRKQSLRRHENFFRKRGELVVTHSSDGAWILPQLTAFFEQHVARRAVTGDPSLFEDVASRAFYRRMTELAGTTGWLRFTRIDWDGQPIAFHYGSSYHGRYLYGIPSFDVALRDRSPGEVLLRHLLLRAIDEAAMSFDFGIGDEPYKYRFATHEATLRTWGLYPR
jgi:CelD/BcsL family acetyltransferase involved in cellulose biosynthesis